MTERIISKNLRKELKRIWGNEGYTKRMLFGPPLTDDEVTNHDLNLNNEASKTLNFNQNDKTSHDKNEFSRFTLTKRSTSRILKRRSQSSK